jgi:hypothetical protein
MSHAERITRTVSHFFGTGTMTDSELLDGFERCTLANSSFYHEEHVRVAFLYLSRLPVLEALQRFQEGLRRFASTYGKPDVYNETVTWAYIFLIRERVARMADSPDWATFKASNPDLLDRSPNLLSRYYRPETLSSPLAKSTFVFPDRI